MGQSELSRFSEIVGTIYEGATDPALWTSRILPALAEYIQTSKCAMITPLHPPQIGGFHFIHGISQKIDDLRKSVYLNEDVWTQAGIAKGLFLKAMS